MLRTNELRVSGAGTAVVPFERSDLAGFNYAQYKPEVAEQLRQRAGRICAIGRRQIKDAVSIGQELLAAKEQLDHGEFGPWVKSELRLSMSSAANYMHVAEHFASKFARVANLQPRTVYMLAAPST